MAVLFSLIFRAKHQSKDRPIDQNVLLGLVVVFLDLDARVFIGSKVKKLGESSERARFLCKRFLFVVICWICLGNTGLASLSDGVGFCFWWVLVFRGDDRVVDQVKAFTRILELVQ